MSPSAPQTFDGISPDRYARLAEKARSAGIPMDGNSGSATKFGVEITWSYSPETQQLTIQCLRAPFFMKSHEVDARIRTLVQQTLAA